MSCELCREGDMWIKTCKSPSGTLLKVCDLCYAEHATELMRVCEAKRRIERRFHIGDHRTRRGARSEGLEAVHESGAVNMLCRMDVVVAAHYFGYPAARDWVAEPENFEVYARGVFEGFEAEVE